MTRSGTPVIVIAALLLALPVLAVLQYNWVGQIGHAELERMQSHLRTESAQFAGEFNGALRGLLMALQTSGPRDLPAVSEWFSHWSETAPERNFVRALYATEGGEDDLYLFDQGRGGFVRAEWPPQLSGLRARLQANLPPGPGFGPVDEDIPVLVAPRFRGPPPDGPPPRIGRGFGRPFPPPRGFLIVELNLGHLQQEMIPSLVGRHFAPDYDIRIVSRANPARLIYQTDPNLSADSFASADARMAIFDLRPQGQGPPAAENPGRWQVLIKRKSGSLEATVNQVRIRNLGVSFAILSVMAASIVMLLISTRRAQRLAGLQMDFVVGVSHELRTPLSVICSAADNLADGLIANPTQVQRYGSVIRGEGRRLSEMVEQILRFAGIQTGKAKYQLKPVQVSAIVDRAVESCQAAVQESGCNLDKQVDPGLPPIMADETSLAHCVGNLITNAAKYASAGRWIGVRAQVDHGSGDVRISVEDKGPGIEPADLPHVFEPFYRGSRAIADQIHGAGLGLSLVKRIVEAHAGSVEVENGSDRGACFTLRVKTANGTANSTS